MYLSYEWMRVEMRTLILVRDTSTDVNWKLDKQDSDWIEDMDALETVQNDLHLIPKDTDLIRNFHSQAQKDFSLGL